MKKEISLFDRDILRKKENYGKKGKIEKNVR